MLPTFFSYHHYQNTPHLKKAFSYAEIYSENKSVILHTEKGCDLVLLSIITNPYCTIIFVW